MTISIAGPDHHGRIKTTESRAEVDPLGISSAEKGEDGCKNQSGASSTKSPSTARTGSLSGAQRATEPPRPSGFNASGLIAVTCAGATPRQEIGRPSGAINSAYRGSRSTYTGTGLRSSASDPVMGPCSSIHTRPSALQGPEVKEPSVDGDPRSAGCFSIGRVGSPKTEPSPRGVNPRKIGTVSGGTVGKADGVTSLMAVALAPFTGRWSSSLA